MTAETAGVIGIGIVQLFIFAKVLIDGKTKARESHLLSVEKGFDTVTKRQDDELKRLREQVDSLHARLEEIRDHLRQCELAKTVLETRLLLLERFRNVAAADDPTGKTKEAMPPPLEK